MVRNEGNTNMGQVAAGATDNQPQSLTKPSIDARLEELWSVDLPAWLDDWFPPVAHAVADGAWTAAWRGVAAFAPIVAFALGLISRLIFRDLNVAYTESLFFMLLVVAGATMSGTVGVGLLAGYIVQDLLLSSLVGPGATTGNAVIGGIGLFGGKLVSYLLLAIPAVILPQLARQLTGGAGLRALTDPRLRIAGAAVLDAVVCGALVFLWSQSMLVLIRPLFSLVGAELPSSVVRPVQQQWIWLVLAAMLAAAARVVVVRMYLPRSQRAGLVAYLQRRRFTGDHPAMLERVPEVVRVAIATLVLTLVLAGTYEGWLDAIVAALVIGLLGLWRANLISRIPVPVKWALLVRNVHPLLRLLGATLAGYVLTIIVVAPFWSAFSGLRLLLVGSLLTLLIFNVLFPPLPVVQPTQKVETPQAQPPEALSGPVSPIV